MNLDISYNKELNLDVEGLVVVPIIGNMHVKGSSNSKFDDFTIVGKGTIYILVDWEYEFEITPNGYTLKMKRIEKGQEVSFSFSAPHASMLNKEDIESKIKKIMDEKEQFSQMSTLEKLIFARLEKRNDQIEQKPESLKKLEKNDAPIMITGDLLLSKIENQKLILYTEKPYTEYIRLSLRELHILNHRECYYFLWYDQDGKRAILIFDYDKQQIRIVDCNTAQSINKIHDITKIANDKLGNIFAKKQDPLDISLIFYVCREYARRIVWYEKPTVSLFDNGKILEIPKNTTIFWKKENQIYEGEIPETEFFDKKGNDLYNEISRIQIDGYVFFLGCRSSRTEVSFSLLQFLHDGINFYPDFVSGKKNMPVKIVFGNLDKEIAWDVFYYISELLWQGKLNLLDCKCYIGQEGGFIFNQEGFWVISAQELPTASIHTATWKTFEDWNFETDRLLPTELNTIEKRKALSHDFIASQVIEPFSKLRISGWGASPMGLMINITKKK